MSRPRSQDLPDWILGAPGKRLVLTCVFDEANEEREWTERALHDAVGADRHASLGKHLEALARLGLMHQVRAPAGQPRRYRLVARERLASDHREIRAGLESLLALLDRVSPHR
jgi:DNA-binding transcriptional ArsR family regulator